MKSFPPLIALLVAATILGDLALMLAMLLDGRYWPTVPGVTAMGLAFAQIALAAAWLSWGRRPGIFIRFVALLAVVGVGGVLCSAAADGVDAEGVSMWFCLLLVYTAFVTTPLAVGRMFGIALVLRDASATRDLLSKRRWQFSLWQILSLTTAVAVLVGILRLQVFPSDEVLELILFCAAMAVAAHISLWSVLGLRRVLLGACLAVVVSVPIGAALPLTGFAPDDVSQLAAMSGVMGLWIAISGAAVRHSGYRLGRSEE